MRVPQIFHEWLNVMAWKLHQLIIWPDWQMIRKALLDCFKPLYAWATCIIECSEIFIERATSVSAQSKTYSSYKSHNTAKFLIAKAQQELLFYISKCWGG